MRLAFRSIPLFLLALAAGSRCPAGDAIVRNLSNMPWRMIQLTADGAEPVSLNLESRPELPPCAGVRSEYFIVASAVVVQGSWIMLNPRSEVQISFGDREAQETRLQLVDFNDRSACTLVLTRAAGAEAGARIALEGDAAHGVVHLEASTCLTLAARAFAPDQGWKFEAN